MLEFEWPLEDDASFVWTKYGSLYHPLQYNTPLLISHNWYIRKDWPHFNLTGELNAFVLCIWHLQGYANLADELEQLTENQTSLFFFKLL